MDTAIAPRVVIADDHPLFRAALCTVLAQSLPGARITEAETWPALQAGLEADSEVDLLLLDLRMPGAEGFSSLLEVRAHHPQIPVVIVSAAEDPALIVRALALGAAGFVPKSAPMNALAEAIRCVLDGGQWRPAIAATATLPDSETELRKLQSLTPQQVRVFRRMADGRLNKQIAADLDITEATVKAHVTAILRKFGFYRRTQAALAAHRLLATEEAPRLPDSFDNDDG